MAHSDTEMGRWTRVERAKKGRTGAAGPKVKGVLRSVASEVSDDNLSMLAAGIAYYAMLAIFPGIVALVSIYGLIASPEQVQQQLSQLSGVLPKSAYAVLSDYLGATAARSSSALSWGLILGIGGALWSASAGVAALIKAVNIAYDVEDTRGFVRLRALSIVLTFALLIFMVLAVLLIAILPGVFGFLGLGGIYSTLLTWARWPLLGLLAVVGIAVLYRLALAHRGEQARRGGFHWGALVATLLWIGGSLLFSLYASNFGKFGETYGGLAGAIVLMLWFFVSAFAILLGAELNAALRNRLDWRRREASARAGSGREAPEWEGSGRKGPPAEAHST